MKNDQKLQWSNNKANTGNKNFIKISLIIKECPEEIMIKLEIVQFFQSLAETLQNKTTSIYTYPPRNGGRPDNSWYIIQPRAQRQDLYTFFMIVFNSKYGEIDNYLHRVPTEFWNWGYNCNDSTRHQSKDICPPIS
jgi:hypothetical protein